MEIKDISVKDINIPDVEISDTIYYSSPPIPVAPPVTLSLIHI